MLTRSNSSRIKSRAKSKRAASSNGCTRSRSKPDKRYVVRLQQFKELLVMTDYLKKLLPRFRYGVIQPRAHEEVQRARSYQLYRLLPLEFMEISTGLGLENYTKEGVEKAIKNYWPCIDRLVKER